MKRNLINCLIEFSGIEVSMTSSQYKLYKNNEISLADIKIINSFDGMLPKLIDDPVIKRGIVVGVATSIMLMSNPIICYASEQTAEEAVNSIGNKLLAMAQNICYWVCLIMGIRDIIKELMKGDALHDPGDIVKVIVKYSLAFASVYFMPYLFNVIKKSF